MTPIADQPTNVTDLLLKWRRGDEQAFQQLIPLVHQELHQIVLIDLASSR
jgi:hypothetical protein